MKKILIIEDDSLLADIYRDNFENAGFESEIATDGALAIESLKNNPPDLVVSDLMLPSLNGVEVVKFIRSQPSFRELPVVVMSNAHSGALGQEAKEAGATKCLSKNTCSPKRLVEEVLTLLSAIPPVPVVATTTSATSTAPIEPEPAPEPAPVAETVEPAAEDPLGAPEPAPSSDTSISESPGIQRRELVLSMPNRIKELRQILFQLGKSGEVERYSIVIEMQRSIHKLAGSSSFAGLTRVALLASAVEALVNELVNKPAKVNPSSLRTIAQAVDVLALLSDNVGDQQEEAVHSPLILILDDEPISRETISTALEQARLRAISIDDPAIALKLVEENRFDLVFLDVEMPGMDGFEVCKRLHATAVNAKTPVVFVTGLTGFETRAKSTLSGGIDFIAKPILMIELSVKALTHLLRNKAGVRIPS